MTLKTLFYKSYGIVKTTTDGQNKIVTTSYKLNYDTYTQDVDIYMSESNMQGSLIWRLQPDLLLIITGHKSLNANGACFGSLFKR